MDYPRFPLMLPPEAFAQLPPEAAPPSNPLFDDAAAAAQADPDADPLAFTPVPRQRQRRAGWSAERQRGFIDALSQCGSVAAAARSIGMSARSAYRLLDAPGACDFARAWDAAYEMGYERTRVEALERALHGAFVPVYRKGRLVRVEHRRSDRLAIAVLSGRRIDVHPAGSGALHRRKGKLMWRALEEERVAEEACEAEAAAEYRAQIEAILEADAIAQKAARIPRVRAL